MTGTAEQQLLARAARRLRMERGMNLRQAAGRLDLDYTNLSRLENGKRGLRRNARHPALTAESIAAAFGVTVEEVRRPCPRCGYTPPAGFTCDRCGMSGGEQPGSWTEVKYLMEGTLDDKPWVPFSSEMSISEAQAAEMYDSWRANRDNNTGFEFRYRLLKRVTTVQVLASEEEVNQS